MKKVAATPVKGAAPAAASSSSSSSSSISPLPSFNISQVSFSRPEPEEQQSSASNVMKYSILGLICLISFAIRLFAVVRWESVIHEFDPHFNYRTTKYLANEGFYSFLNWQDDRSWYPLGRLVGGTVYPGLMVTARFMHWFLNAINISINVRNMCVFLAPIFAAITAVATYLLTSEVTQRSSTGLIAAAMVGIVPSYISRSVGGSYDNEGVAIFALIFTFYLWVKAVSTGRLFWSVLTALAYWYMVLSWGGYIFIINIIPIYTVVLIFSGRYSSRLYIAYTTFYSLGSLLAMQVPFVGFNVVKQAESAASHGVFLMVQVVQLYLFLTAHIPAASLKRLAMALGGLLVGGTALSLIALQLTGRMEWTGRSLTLLDPTYAKKYIPIIASVSEHQPTSWTSFFFDLHIAVPFAPAGLFFLFNRLTDAKIFLIIYGTIAWYFAGVMVRLMLTLAPVACMLGAVGISGLLNTFSGHLHASWGSWWKKGDQPAAGTTTSTTPAKAAPAAGRPASSSSSSERVPWTVSLTVLLGTLCLLVFYAFHATYVSSEAYSSPSIVLASRRQDGSRVIFDDFREAYYWLRMNTADDAKVMSWWDYGYQMTSMGNRTVLVDNNTWNNTHIATVGRAMASPEEESYPIMHSLDVDYVLVIFGGLTGYQSDDINKFLWMVRIGGGVFPHIKESDYFADGQYRMDRGGSPTMLNTLMYKMCYHRFDEVMTQYGRPAGYDLARSIEQGHKNIRFQHLEEVFTSEHWIVRIYRRKALPNRDGRIFDASAFDKSEDQFGRRPAALSGGKARPRKHLPLWNPANPSGSSGNGAAAEEQKPAVTLMGCYKSEVSFGSDRVYGGGTTGAYISLARSHAVTQGKKYFAVARLAGDGHSFAFNGPLPAPDATGGSCERACLDEKDYPCGCADAACSEPIEPGHDNVRRWVVYRVDQEGSSAPAKAPAAAARGGRKAASSSS